MHKRRVATPILDAPAPYIPAHDDNDSPEPIDAAALARLRQECDSPGETLSNELLELYTRDLGSRITAIREAVNRGDTMALMRAAHALNGSSVLIGAQPMAELCLELEQAGRNDMKPAARSLLPRLAQEAMRLRQALGSVLHATNTNASGHYK